MKRKMITMITVMLLLLCLDLVNVSSATGSYYTTSRQYISSIYNSYAYGKTAYCKLYPEGGIAWLQICNSTGSQVLNSGYYPVNPTNPNYVTFAMPPYVTYTIYVRSADGNLVWGTVDYGIS